MKKGYIILSGGGDVDMTFELDKNYFSLLNYGAKILYIPAALNFSSPGFESAYDWFSSLIAKHATEKEIDFSMLLKGDEVLDFQSFDSIYIGGGNTYKLLDFIYKNKLENKIIDYIKKGGVLYGGSAGAIILGKDIRTVEEENNKGYIHYKGLNILGGKSVFCHYNKSYDQKLYADVKKIGSEIFALSENAGMIFNSRESFFETLGEVFVFSEEDKRKI